MIPISRRRNVLTADLVCSTNPKPNIEEAPGLTGEHSEEVDPLRPTYLGTLMDDYVAGARLPEVEIP